jgi:hypothetical protein
MVKLPKYDGQIRQLAVTGLDREQPILFLSNITEESCPYQKFHPTLGEVGANMLICDY